MYIQSDRYAIANVITKGTSGDIDSETVGARHEALVNMFRYLESNIRRSLSGHKSK